MNHYSIIQSSVDGYIGCFHVLAVVNGAAVENGIHVCFSISDPTGHMTRSSVNVSFVVFIPRFKGISILSSIVAVSVCIPTNSAIAPSPVYTVCRCFVDGYSDLCEVIPHCSLICISLLMNDAKHLFTCLHVFFGEMSV